MKRLQVKTAVGSKGAGKRPVKCLFNGLFKSPSPGIWPSAAGSCKVRRPAARGWNFP